MAVRLKHFGINLFLLSAFAATCSARQRPGVPACFKVHSMIRADADHYWASWTNACPYTIDSVYVLVGFMDETRHPLGNGVWALYFITSGASRVVQFSIPAEAADFQWVRLLKITTDSQEALRTQSPVAFRPDRPAGDPGPSFRAR